MGVIELSNPQKWLKWGIGAGGTLAIALLFQAVRQNDTYLEAVAANQDSQKKQTAQISNRDSLDPSRSNDERSPSDTLPETGAGQPFLFVLPQEPAASLKTGPQARTHASFVAPERMKSNHVMSKYGEWEDHHRENHDREEHAWENRDRDAWATQVHDEHEVDDDADDHES